MSTEQRISDAIRTLEELAGDFAVKVQSPPLPEGAEEERRICKEALLSISVLLPKLRTARGLAACSAARFGPCEACQDA
jgi:hypothetical protein